MSVWFWIRFGSWLSGADTQLTALCCSGVNSVLKLCVVLNGWFILAVFSQAISGSSSLLNSRRCWRAVWLLILALQAVCKPVHDAWGPHGRGNVHQTYWSIKFSPTWTYSCLTRSHERPQNPKTLPNVLSFSFQVKCRLSVWWNCSRRSSQPFDLNIRPLSRPSVRNLSPTDIWSN